MGFFHRFFHAAPLSFLKTAFIPVPLQKYNFPQMPGDIVTGKGGNRMTYITITGTQYYAGESVFQIGGRLRLVKEPSNTADEEAIKVVSERDVLYGYCANSVSTVARGTHSAGYIYRDFDRETHCRVLFVLNGSVIAELEES